MTSEIKAEIIAIIKSKAVITNATTAIPLIIADIEKKFKIEKL